MQDILEGENDIDDDDDDGRLHEKGFARQQKYCLDVGVVVRSG
jgi:hypothetical protein